MKLTYKHLLPLSLFFVSFIPFKVLFVPQYCNENCFKQIFLLSFSHQVFYIRLHDSVPSSDSIVACILFIFSSTSTLLYVVQYKVRGWVGMKMKFVCLFFFVCIKERQKNEIGCWTKSFAVSSLQPSLHLYRFRQLHQIPCMPRLPHLLLLCVFQLVNSTSASWQEEEVGGKRHVPNSPRGSLPNAGRGAAAVRNSAHLCFFFAFFCCGVKITGHN